MSSIAHVLMHTCEAIFQSHRYKLISRIEKRIKETVAQFSRCIPHYILQITVQSPGYLKDENDEVILEFNTAAAYS